MKIIELHQVPKNKRGSFNKNNVKPEPHEEKAAKLLILYGFNIELIRPTNTPKVRNPDFLMDGAIWEVKSPITNNLKTIKKRMHEASEQATRVIVDLRRVKHNDENVEKAVIKRFCNKGAFRQMILIQKSGKVISYRK